jgi:hypothetical protein
MAAKKLTKAQKAAVTKNKLAQAVKKLDQKTQQKKYASWDVASTRPRDFAVMAAEEKYLAKSKKAAAKASQNVTDRSRTANRATGIAKRVAKKGK